MQDAEFEMSDDVFEQLFKMMDADGSESIDMREMITFLE
jgi:Ca2+-binding EF-hand superfamily protein